MTKEELGDLIVASERQLYCTARTLLRNDEDCADAIQETIIKAFTKIGSLRRDEYARTWLIRILINECYTLLRRRQRQVPLESHPEVLDVAAPERSDYTELYETLSRLPRDLKLPVILYYLDELSVREVAGVLNITEGAVKKRLFRARRKLRGYLESMEVYQ